LARMLNKLNKNLKSNIKHLSDNFSPINTKAIIYAGLTAYWGIILIGTFINI